MDTQTQTQNQEQGKKCCGIKTIAIIAIVIVLAVLVYYFAIMTKENPLTDTEKQTIINQIQGQSDDITANLQQASSSDELEAIADDLQNTELNNLDKELENIQNEMNG